MFVTAGSDMYGRVKSVGGTPIVTQFAMLQFLPLVPTKSYYFLGNERTEHSGVPILASSSTTEFDAIPLRRIDLVSVLMTYVRAFIALMLILGVLGTTLFVTLWIGGEHMDESQQIAMQVVIGTLVASVVAGILTYLVPLTTPRQKRIRTHCGQLLGICVDPARVTSQAATMLEEVADDAASESESSRSEILRKLVSIRAKIARGAKRRAMEEKTTELLEKLDRGPRRISRKAGRGPTGTRGRRRRRQQAD